MKYLEWLADKISYAFLQKLVLIILGAVLMLLIIGVFHLPV